MSCCGDVAHVARSQLPDLLAHTLQAIHGENHVAIAHEDWLMLRPELVEAQGRWA